MKIENRIIGKDCPPLVIAEIGINHEGSLDVAKQMVDAAASSGAEIINAVLIFIFSGLEFLSTVINNEGINDKLETIIINMFSIFVGIAALIFK